MSHRMQRKDFLAYAIANGSGSSGDGTHSWEVCENILKEWRKGVGHRPEVLTTRTMVPISAFYFQHMYVGHLCRFETEESKREEQGVDIYVAYSLMFLFEPAADASSLGPARGEASGDSRRSSGRSFRVCITVFPNKQASPILLNSIL